MRKFLAATTLAAGAVLIGLPADAAPPIGWADQLAQCAINYGVDASQIGHPDSDQFISMTIPALDLLLFSASCMTIPELTPAWLFDVMSQTADIDGVQAITFENGLTVLWSYDSDNSELFLVVTEEQVEVQ
jgi:hypothetical protein